MAMLLDHLGFFYLFRVGARSSPRKSVDGGLFWPDWRTQLNVRDRRLVRSPVVATTRTFARGQFAWGQCIQERELRGDLERCWRWSGGVFVRSLTIDPDLPATLYAATGTGVFKSVDSGLSWGANNSGMHAPILDLALDPQDPNTLYAATTTVLLKTADGGATWNAANSGLIAGGHPLAIDPQNTNTVFAAACSATGCAVIKSTDTGMSWSPSWIASDSSSNWVTTIAIDPQNSNILYATTQGFDECQNETLHMSLDGGMSWSDSLFRDLGVSATCVLALAIDPQNPSNLYAAFEFRGGVFKSTVGIRTLSPEVRSRT